MIKTTIYCSNCGKGNIVEKPEDGKQFRCLSCSSLNTIRAKKSSVASSGRSLKDVYQKSQSAIVDPSGNAATFRRKRTLVDKNIDLLEKVEQVEKQNADLKANFAEMAVSNGSTTGFSEEQWNELFSRLDVIPQLEKRMEEFQSNPIEAPNIDLSLLLEELKNISSLNGQVSELAEVKSTLQQELKALQQAVNMIAGDVRVVKSEVESLRRSGVSVNASSQSVSPEKPTNLPSGGDFIEKTTQILAVDSDSALPSDTERTANSLTQKPKKSKSFKAVSDKLKSLKL